MKAHTWYSGAAAAALIAPLATNCLADPGKTRDQVYAELIAARQAGSIPEGEPAIAPRDVFPWLYPADPSASAPKSAAQARAELQEALRQGTMITGFQGLMPRQLNPELYPPAPVLARAKSREQVESELATGLRAGKVAYNFQGLTPRQLAHGADLAPASEATIVHASGPAPTHH